MQPVARRMRRAACDFRLTAAACAGLVLAGCAAVAPPPAATDASGTVNEARSRGCGAASRQVSPLRADPRLDAVAARLPGGVRLADAVSAERYPAARSASIRVSRAADSASLYELLTARFCSDVADPEFRTIGIARRGEDLWIVLAAPFTAPPVSDPGTVARRAVALVNQARSQPRRCGSQAHAAVPPVVLDTTLTSVATAHARDMARTGRMAHEGSDGSTAAERVTPRRLRMAHRRGERRSRRPHCGGGHADLACEPRALHEPDEPGRAGDGNRLRLRSVEPEGHVLGAGIRDAPLKWLGAGYSGIIGSQAFSTLIWPPKSAVRGHAAVDPFVIVIGIALLATVGALLIGLLVMSGGGNTDAHASTPLMWARVGSRP
jgi:hypothetical protein